ncbi:hypothetical protein [Streptomyces sp. NBC_01462]|uniref:hypothetical protein n=1 Tax=Streptomyces sp. NBC_01462 TaxID=2903876 RepID=UPI003FCCF03B
MCSRSNLLGEGAVEEDELGIVLAQRLQQGRGPVGEQLALLIDGAAARTRVLNADAFPAAAAIAAVLIDNAIPATASDDRRREEVSS